MHFKTAKEILFVMHDYKSKGKKSPYKKKQMRRLMSILENIVQSEQQELQDIGRKHIIGYYRRHTDETYKTLKEKYSILEKFFSRYNPRLKVPKPDPQKCISQQTHVDKP